MNSIKIVTAALLPLFLSAFSSRSSSRAFPTLSSCVRSLVACVKWWRVTFSGSQVGVLEAQKKKACDDISYEMKEEKQLLHLRTSLLG